MRRLLTVKCEGALLGATIDGDRGSTGFLFVTGGSQTRIGSHRMYERLAASLAQAGWPCLRYDRRGVGDSEGEDPDFKESGPDLAAAAAAFRREQPQLKRLIGFGLCDGASTLALHGGAAGLDGYVLVNPWFVEAEAGEPPAAAIKSRYKEQLLSAEGWKRLLSGSISYASIRAGKIVSSRPRACHEIARRWEGPPGQLVLRPSTRPRPPLWRCSSAFGRCRRPNRLRSTGRTLSRGRGRSATVGAVRGVQRPAVIPRSLTPGERLVPFSTRPGFAG